MANLSQVGLDPEVPEAGEGFEVLPAGEYTCVITADDVRDNKKGTGKLIELDLKITAGQYTGVNLKDYISLTNPNADAARIGQGQLKKICNLCGVSYPPTDTSKLWGKPLNIRVSVESFVSNKSGETLKSNKIKAYKPAGAAPDPSMPTEPPQQSGW